jgi:hypothetical protein
MLEVHRPLSVGGSTLAGEELRPLVILGDSRGTKITLYKTRERLRNPGGPTFFSAEFLLIGRHFDSAEVVLSSLFVRFTHLEEWIDKEPFNVELHGGSSGQGSIAYSPPELIELELPEKGFRLQLTHSAKRNFGGFRAIKWEHHAWIKISAQHNEPLDWYSDIVFSLSRLLSLLVGKPVIPIELNGLPPSEGERTEDGLEQREVDVFFDGFVRPGTEQQNTSPFFRILVPLPKLETSMAQVLEAWFAREEVMRPVHNLYLATLGSTKMYVEFEFLALTQARRVLCARQGRVIRGRFRRSNFRRAAKRPGAATRLLESTRPWSVMLPIGSKENPRPRRTPARCGGSPHAVRNPPTRQKAMNSCTTCLPSPLNLSSTVRCLSSSVSMTLTSAPSRSKDWLAASTPTVFSSGISCKARSSACAILAASSSETHWRSLEK